MGSCGTMDAQGIKELLTVSNFNANVGNVCPWKSAEAPGEESRLHTICVCSGMFRGMSVSSVIGCCE